ncbi:hypothetical protein B7486_05725 [cyanobacterium TDX16]|nr:hypothetical protein B7486_05725 [cyanobacterium TDX16]
MTDTGRKFAQSGNELQEESAHRQRQLLPRDCEGILIFGLRKRRSLDVSDSQAQLHGCPDNNSTRLVGFHENVFLPRVGRRVREKSPC